MITASIRIRHPKRILCLAAAAVLLVFLMGKNSVLPAFRPNIRVPRCSTNEERVEWLQSLGWEAESQPISVREVMIPKQFDEIYQKYALIQRNQGFQLEKNRGKTAVKYCYAITNYRDGKEKAVASILQRGDKIIAADLSSARLGGFLKELIPVADKKKA